jgi:anthranilate synthase component 2
MNSTKPSVLLVDNNDSFTYNLVQIIREYGKCLLDIRENRHVNIAESGRYDGFIFSPGPGIPGDFPAMAGLLETYKDKKIFLGICLGHQAIAEYFGLRLNKMNTPSHGLREIISIHDSADYIFKGLPSEFHAGLYHSWSVDGNDEIMVKKSGLRITATGGDKIPMALTHREYDIKGVQFHPESYLTDNGSRIITNWIDHLLL